jgi:hypothetical protein
MESYAVLWQEGGAAPVTGRLDFGARNLTLHGGHRGAEVRVDIPYTDICAAERGRESIGPLRAIRLDSRTRGSMLLATLGGLTLRGEILESLQRAVSAVV